MAQVYVNMTGIGSGGINTDSPPWAVGPQQATAMRDVINHRGLSTQRRGWANYLGPIQSSVGPPAGVGVYFVSPTGLMSTVASTYNAAGVGYGVYSQNQVNASWSPILYPTLGIAPRYVPRAQYRDEILLCDQNGVYPMLRFMGRIGDAISALTMSIAANSSVITASTSGASSIGGTGLAPPPWSSVNAQYGSFLHPYVEREVPSLRVTKQTTSDFTVEAIQFVNAAASSGAFGTLQMWGTTWPCVSVADDGLLTWTTGTNAVTGEGTTFSGGTWGSVFVGSGMLMPMSDSLRVKLPTKWTQHAITSVSSATAMSVRPVLGDLAGTKATYDIMRRSPFREVEVHGECLWGTGVQQYPNRVYYSTRGWDMQTPPRLTPPWNGITDFYDPRDGMMDWIPIQGDGSGDRVMGLLTSDGPLLVLTERACFGIYGKWPTFEQQMIASGAGCIDTRSATGTSAYGQYWAGEFGIYGYRRGKVTDLTAGRINNYWRDLMRRYDYATGSYVVCGVTKNHLVVSAKVTSGSTTTVTLGCNLATGAWTEFTNMNIVGMHAPSVWDSDEALIASIAGSQQLVDIAPAINMTGTPADANGTYPSLYIASGTGHANEGNPDSETRLVELRLDGVVKDTTSASPSRLTVSTTSQGAVSQGVSVAQSNDVLAGPGTDNIRRERLRVGNSGRTHQVVIATQSTSADNTQISVSELGMNVRKRRAAR